MRTWMAAIPRHGAPRRARRDALQRSAKDGHLGLLAGPRQAGGNECAGQLHSHPLSRGAQALRRSLATMRGVRFRTLGNRTKISRAC